MSETTYLQAKKLLDLEYRNYYLVLQKHFLSKLTKTIDKDERKKIQGMIEEAGRSYQETMDSIRKSREMTL